LIAPEILLTGSNKIQEADDTDMKSQKKLLVLEPDLENPQLKASAVTSSVGTDSSVEEEEEEEEELRLQNDNLMQEQK